MSEMLSSSLQKLKLQACMLILLRNCGCHLEIMYFFKKSGYLKRKKNSILRIMDVMLKDNRASGP